MHQPDNACPGHLIDDDGLMSWKKAISALMKNLPPLLPSAKVSVSEWDMKAVACVAFASDNHTLNVGKHVGPMPLLQPGEMFQ